MENSQLTEKKTVFKQALCAFTDHPRLADETYFEHLCFTWKMAGTLFLSAFAVAIHGLLPFVCTHTASKKLEECNKVLSDRAVKTCPDKKAQKE